MARDLLGCGFPIRSGLLGCTTLQLFAAEALGVCSCNGRGGGSGQSVSYSGQSVSEKCRRILDVSWPIAWVGSGVEVEHCYQVATGPPLVVDHFGDDVDQGTEVSAVV